MVELPRNRELSSSKQTTCTIRAAGIANSIERTYTLWRSSGRAGYSISYQFIPPQPAANTIHSSRYYLIFPLKGENMAIQHHNFWHWLDSTYMQYSDVADFACTGGSATYFKDIQGSMSGHAERTDGCPHDNNISPTCNKILNYLIRL